MLKSVVVITLLGNLLGDNDNIKGIDRSLVKMLGSFSTSANIKVDNRQHEASDQQIAELQKKIDDAKPGEMVLVLGAGNDGRVSLAKLDKQGKENIKFVWSGHHLPQDFVNFENIDFLVIPKSAFNTVDIERKNSIQQAETKVIETIGVPHNKTIEQITEAYNGWTRDLKLPDNNGLTLVVLPGDAPDIHHKQHRYTPQSAESLGYELGKSAAEHKKILLVTNGPRTGKYDEAGTAVISDHKQNSPTDQVTKAFIEAVGSSGLESSRIIVSDFKFGMPNNLYDAFLGAIRLYKEGEYNVAVIAGESTTQVTTAIDLLHPGQVYILSADRNDAMSKTHIDFVQDIVEKGYAQKFPSDYANGPFHSNIDIPTTDAERAAMEILGSLGLGDGIQP